MDYRLYHDNLISDPNVYRRFREKLDKCARKLDVLPARYRQDAVWSVRVFKFQPEGFRLQVEMDWPVDPVAVAGQGECLLTLTDQVLQDFRESLAEKIGMDPPIREPEN